MDENKPAAFNKAFLFIFLILVLLTIATHYYGSVDVGDYSDVAKFFAGDFLAKTRTSHSYVFGFIHYPFVALTNNFIFFKISSLFFLLLIIISVYYLSNKDKKSLWLMLLSPAVWYMAPWINPVQLASLILLWAYHFMDKYDKTEKIFPLLLSGLLVGLGSCFWNTSLFIGLALMISFLFNKKFYNLLLFCLAALIGLMPLLILDTILFNFPLYTLLKTTSSQVLFVFSGKGIYEISQPSNRLFDTFIVLLSMPIYFWMLYKPSFFKENKKSMIFLSLSIIVILSNPQIRYSLAIIPVMILLMTKKLNNSQFKKQIIISIILILLFTFPYILQIRYNINNSVNSADTSFMFYNLKNITLSDNFYSGLLSNDLNNISKAYPNQTFLVGNNPDDYQLLADLYWQKNIKEFVSIQDYDLYMKNQTILLSKTFMPKPNIPDRRQIWISGGLSKNENDNTDYNNIKYALAIGSPIDENNFRLIKKYNVIYLSEKINPAINNSSVNKTR